MWMRELRRSFTQRASLFPENDHVSPRDQGYATKDRQRKNGKIADFCCGDEIHKTKLNTLR